MQKILHVVAIVKMSACAREIHVLKVCALECTEYHIQSTHVEVHLLEGMNVSDESDLSAIALGQHHFFYCGIAVTGVL